MAGPIVALALLTAGVAGTRICIRPSLACPGRTLLSELATGDRRSRSRALARQRRTATNRSAFRLARYCLRGLGQLSPKHEALRFALQLAG